MGDVVLAPGRRTVYLDRQRTRGGFGSISHSSQPRDDDRLGWIADLLRTEPADLPAHPESSEWICWTNATAYTKAVEAARGTMVAGWWALARRLVDAGLLSDADARALRPNLSVHVEDARTDRTTPLPEVSPPDLACPWSPSAK